MRLLGKFSGFVIIGLFILEAFRFVLKFVFKRYGKWIKANTKYHPILLKMMKYNQIVHPYTGYLTLLAILIHAYIQTGFTWFSTTGLIAASLMLTEVIVGFLGQYILKKPRPKAWLWFHRLMPIIIIIAILNHFD